MAPVGIGERLRSAREALGLSLEEIENATHIRRAYLQALELEAFHELPGPAYARGFLRSYAAYLGLSSRELVELYPGGPPLPVRPRAPVEVRITPATPTSRAHRFITGVVAILGIGILALGYVVYGQVRQFMESASVPPPQHAPPNVEVTTPNGSASSPASVTPSPGQGAAGQGASPPAQTSAAPAPSLTTGPAPAAVPPAPAQGTPGQRPSQSEHASLPPASPSATTASAAGTTPASSSLHVIATANDRSWVRATADGTTLFEGFMSAGDRQVWDATHQLIVRVGNASAIDISVNGRPVGRLGGPGDVVERTFSPEGKGSP
jgi:cytoskeleton protein RodZ